MAVRIFFLLCSLGLAITAEAQNCGKPVLGPYMTLKSSVIDLEEFEDGQKINLGCEIGYTPAGGSTAITCNAGTWTDVTMVCELKDCGRADDPVKGEVQYPEGTKFGATAVVVCMPGHRLVGRSDKIRCGNAGWMNRVPECEVQKCDPPASVANGKYSPIKDIYQYRDVVEIQCGGSLYLIGAKSLMCSENGSFTPSPPTCKDVNCKKPNIPYSEWISGARVNYQYKSTVTHKCITGYEEIGSKTSVCESDGEWVPKLLECKEKASSTKPPKTEPDDEEGGKDSSGSNAGPIAGGVGATGVVLGVGAGAYIRNRKKSKQEGFQEVQKTQDEENAEL